MSRKCSACGFAFNPDDAHYCGRCGNNISPDGHVWKLYDWNVCSTVPDDKLKEYRRLEKEEEGRAGKKGVTL